MDFRKSISTYYRLTKPGIIYGNLITAIGGFALAAKGHYNILLLLTTLFGTSCVIAAACVYNNVMDRGIDKKMMRTRKRALVRGIVTARQALVFATVLMVLGFAILALKVNALVVLIGLIGFVDYVFLYGFTKRRSSLSTLVGSISGATPIVAGYCAVTNRFDSGALFLFLIMVLWQMPHFYAIALYRLEDYAAAALPVLPVRKGAKAARLEIILYMIAFLIAVLLPTVYGYTGPVYTGVMVAMGCMWLWFGFKGYRTDDLSQWARRVFLFSLLIILVLPLTLITNVYLS